MFNNFVKSMMALCMVTSGWSSNGVGDLLKTSEHKQKNNENSIVQYKVINITLGENGTINERKECEDSDINTSNSSEESIKTVDVGTQTIEEVKSPNTTSETMNKSINTVDTLEIEGHSSGDEGGSSDNLHHNKDAGTSTSSEEVTEIQTENNEKRLVQDCVDIVEDRNADENSEMNEVCKKVSNEVSQLNFLTGQYEKSKFYTPEEAKWEVIEILKAIQPDLRKVYKYKNKNVTFSNLLFALNESRHIWKDSEDLNDFKKIVINLANGEVDSKQFKDNQVLEAIWDMMSRRDYGYDY